MGVFFKSKKEKLEDQELEKYYKIIDEEDKKFEEENKFTLKDFFKEDEDEKDITQYMTDEEKEEYINSKKDIKKFTIFSISLVSVVTIILVILTIVFIQFNKDDLHRIYKQDILDYYYKLYNEKTSIKDDDISYLCYDEVNIETKIVEEKCTNIIKAKDKNNNILMKLDNSNSYADNKNIEHYYNEYNSYIKANNPNMKIIWNNPLISDVDWYHTYNQFEDYINVLPDNNNFINLLDSNKITLRDVIMYTGEFNIDSMKELINKLSDDSKIFLIETANASPINLQVITKEGLANINIVNQINLDDNIINYQLDTSINLINSVTVNKQQAQSIETLSDDYEFINAYNINVTKTRLSLDEDKSNRTEYFLLSFDSSLDDNNIKEFIHSKELKITKYSELYLLKLDTKTYVIGTDNMGIGNISYKSKGILK
jgi:hypothetical protein